jgi:hypothetical protein
MKLLCKISLHKYILNGDDLTPFGYFQYWECKRCHKMVVIRPIILPFLAKMIIFMILGALAYAGIERLILMMM